MTDTTSTASIPTVQGEEWRPVVGHEGLYQVSDRGQVYSQTRTRKGRASMPGERQLHLGRVLSPGVVKGYYRVTLCVGNRSHRRYFIHQLVAAAFIGPCPPGQMVNHIDGVKTNNVPENLEYVTCGDNHRHAFRTGLRSSEFEQGERHHNHKLKAADIPTIRAMVAAGAGVCTVARVSGVGHHAISDVVKGITWRSVPA